MRIEVIVLLAVLLTGCSWLRAERVVWFEAEGFESTGTWSNDSQFVDVMGSPYLLATGLGKPVADAVTQARIPAAGRYRLWVRCRDWHPSHSPGRFQVLVGGRASEVVFGQAKTDAWQWVDGGTFALRAGKTEVRLHDLTGWWGRCDAVVLASGSYQPSGVPAKLAAERLRYRGVSAAVKPAGTYDVVVVGAGPAGLGAAIAAARHGCRVALVQDRPVVGGNASSEIEVPPMGYLGNPPDRINVTGLTEELFPPQSWSNSADPRKMEAVVRAEPGLALFLNTRATGVAMADKATIGTVLALDVRSGQRLSFAAPLFIDCTGHGWIGYYAGAKFRMGQEAREEFGESLAPVKAGRRTMGNSLYKAVFKTRPAPVPFSCPAWAHQWTRSEDFEPLGSHRRIRTIARPGSFDGPSRGKGRNPGNNPDGAIHHAWWVEYGGMLSTITDAETIRDELLRISLGLWNYAKNYNSATAGKNANRELVWLNYVPGVRESRRLVGDYILSQRDYDERIVHRDTVGFTDWGIDVHHPEGYWVRGNDCIHVFQGVRTSIPYRTLYSKNVGNLFMAGRCHSATHVALGGTRVMRPMCMTGQAAGTAAAIARRHDTDPRGVFRGHLQALQQALLKDGCYLMGVPNRDEADLARRATVLASSSADGMGPANVINGWNRVVGKAPNAWSPRPGATGPHWIQLAWDKPIACNVVRLTFRTARTAARQFALQAWRDGTWRTQFERADNGARRHVIALERITTSKLRVVVGEARGLCEIRVYDEPPRLVEVARRCQRHLARPAGGSRRSGKAALPAARKLEGIVLDGDQAKQTGTWKHSTWSQPYVGEGYLHDGNTGKGAKSVRFSLARAKPGRYEVRLAYVAFGNRATNTPVTVHAVGGARTIRVNQRDRPPIDGMLVPLGTFELDRESALVISNEGTDGYVIVDAVQLVPVK